MIKNTNRYIEASFGFGEVLQTGRIDVKALMDGYKAMLLKDDRFYEAKFNYDKLEVANDELIYGDILAKHIVFTMIFTHWAPKTIVFTMILASPSADIVVFSMFLAALMTDIVVFTKFLTSLIADAVVFARITVVFTMFLGSLSADTVVFTNLSVNNPQNIEVCDTGAATYSFDLTNNDEAFLGINNADYDIFYYNSIYTITLI